MSNNVVKESEEVMEENVKEKKNLKEKAGEAVEKVKRVDWKNLGKNALKVGIGVLIGAVGVEGGHRFKGRKQEAPVEIETHDYVSISSDGTMNELNK